jgi:hypothetical protein
MPKLGLVALLDGVVLEMIRIERVEEPTREDFCAFSLSSFCTLFFLCTPIWA